MAGLSDSAREQLFQSIERIVDYEGMELVDLEFKREGRRWILRIYIDRPGGVRLDDCADISNQVGMMLDVEDIIPHSYALEVSSPGLDRPLKRREDFERFQGKLVRIRLADAREGRKKFVGRLEGVEGEEVILNVAAEGKSYRLPLDEIQSARLEVEL